MRKEGGGGTKPAVHNESLQILEDTSIKYLPTSPTKIIAEGGKGAV